MLGKPSHGKQKMNLEELKALSRQIKVEYDIMSLCKNLKENMCKVKSRALHHLKHSSSPKDVQFYHDLMNDNKPPSLTDDDGDDNSSTHSYTPATDLTSLTEDQINFWLQQGGTTSSPITLATDQELAGKKKNSPTHTTILYIRV